MLMKRKNNNEVHPGESHNISINWCLICSRGRVPANIYDENYALPRLFLTVFIIEMASWLPG